MAVPDWPTSFGYNMFFFPWSMIVGGIFYEHSHRLLGALVGALTVGLMAWVWLVDPRRWLKGAAAGAVILVVVQGALGGLRVVWAKDQIGIIHAVSGQAFFVMVAAMALWSSGYWARVESAAGGADALALGRVGRAGFAVLALVLVQLVIGATMRHAHRGLSIPDFPLAYGRPWPLLDGDSMVSINAWRGDVLGLPTTTAGLVLLQMAHRIAAVLAVLGACVLWARARRLLGGVGIRGWGGVVLGLVMAQFVLGAWTVWSNKAADIATGHMAIGALLLATVSLMLIVVTRLKRSAVAAGGAP
jgi:cytochrome c oxidase assembly protein subunit 15